MRKINLENVKDSFTLDGLVKPQPGVTKEKAAFVKNLYEQAQRGNRVAEARLAELFTSTDASFSMAHLLSIATIPQLAEDQEEIDGLMATRTVKDFNPVVLRSIIAKEGVEGAGIGQYGEAAVVPEGTPYPIVSFSGSEESFAQQLNKRGFRFDFTFESWINDLVGELEQMPDRMRVATKNTILADFWDVINQAAQTNGSVSLLDGKTVSANAPLSAIGLIAMAQDIENRTINGNKIGQLPAYNVLVAPGKKRLLEYSLAQFGRVVQVQDGNLTLAPDSDMAALVPNVRIIESNRLTGTNWKMYPKPGTTPRPVVERLVLRGYEQPEIRVRSDQGFYPAGGKVGLFEGGFDADTAAFRFRLVNGAALWDDTWVGISTGAGTVA